MMRRVTWIALPVLCLLFVGGCGGDDDAKGADAHKLMVVVSIVPQESFVMRVGGQHVSVEALVQPNQSPHHFSLTAAQMVRVAESRIYFTIGVPFEEQVLPRIASSHSGLRMVDTRVGIKLRRMATDYHEGQTHADGEEHTRERPRHENGAADPHVWLNPRNVKLMARTICDALKLADAAHATDYEANLEAFIADLDETDQRITRAFAPLKKREFMVFHPAFGYFADAYGLKQLPAQIQGKDPSAKSLVQLIERARAKEIKVIFVQRQFSSRHAQALAEEIGGVVAPVDPLAADYLVNLNNMAQKIERALK